MDASLATLAGALFGAACTLTGQYLNARMNMKTESLKQTFQLEQSKISTIYEDRKKSARRLIEAMYTALDATIRYQPLEDAWEPIDKNNFEDFERVFNEERLFIEPEVDKALILFKSILSEAVLWDWEKVPSYSSSEKDISVRRAHEELDYLTDRITEFLRAQVTFAEKPHLQFEIDLLEACKFINGFKGLVFTGKRLIKLDRWQSPLDLVLCAKKNHTEFRNEFAQFVQFLKTNPQGHRLEENFRSEVSDAEEYLKKLEQRIC